MLLAQNLENQKRIIKSQKNIMLNKITFNKIVVLYVVLDQYTVKTVYLYF